MATIKTSREGPRECGYRHPGGLYLVTDGLGIPCSLLPVELQVCPTCGAGFAPQRTFSWVDPDVLLQPHDHGEPRCPLNEPGKLGERAVLDWIGSKFYKTPDIWAKEARKLGVSRRVSAVPKGFVIGETWVLAAHRSVPMDDGEPRPAVFYVYRPKRVEYIVRGNESEELLDYMESLGMTLVKVEREPVKEGA